jgi:hypothetical protein
MAQRRSATSAHWSSCQIVFSEIDSKDRRSFQWVDGAGAPGCREWRRACEPGCREACSLYRTSNWHGRGYRWKSGPGIDSGSGHPGNSQRETSVPRISKRASPPARLSPGSALRRGTARLLGRPELEDRSVSEGRAGKSGTHGLPGRMAGFLRRDVRASSGSEDGPLDACRVAPVADRVVESGPRGLCATPARPLNSVMRGRGRAPRR